MNYLLAILNSGKNPHGELRELLTDLLIDERIKKDANGVYTIN